MYIGRVIQTKYVILQGDSHITEIHEKLFFELYYIFGHAERVAVFSIGKLTTLFSLLFHFFQESNTGVYIHICLYHTLCPCLKYISEIESSVPGVHDSSDHIKVSWIPYSFNEQIFFIKSLFFITSLVE